jgi:hypothetical protein
MSCGLLDFQSLKMRVRLRWFNGVGQSHNPIQTLMAIATPNGYRMELMVAGLSPGVAVSMVTLAVAAVPEQA